MLERDSIVCVWTTSVKIEETLELLKMWGLTFVTILFVYNKKNKNSSRLALGFGYYTRGQCEYLILAKKGSITKYLANTHNIGQKL